MLLPAPVFSTDTTGITAQVINEKILPMVRQVAYETGCEVINLYNLLIESSRFFPDKVHPSAEGATLIAMRIYELIRMKSVPSFSLLKDLPPDSKPFNFLWFSGL